MADSNPEIDALVAEYGEGTVRAAFNIARAIGRRGIPGIDFTGAAETEMRQHHYHVTKQKVEDEIRKNLRR